MHGVGAQGDLLEAPLHPPPPSGGCTLACCSRDGTVRPIFAEPLALELCLPRGPPRTRGRARAHPRSYLHVALVGCAHASLHVHAEGPPGLLGRDGAHLGGAVLAGDVAREGAHWKREGARQAPRGPPPAWPDAARPPRDSARASARPSASGSPRRPPLTPARARGHPRNMPRRSVTGRRCPWHEGSWQPGKGHWV